jgi:hypothetical protein
MVGSPGCSAFIVIFRRKDYKKNRKKLISISSGVTDALQAPINKGEQQSKELINQ